MTLLYFVRHAKPAATWGASTDSGLDEEGRAQAEKTAGWLAGNISPVRVFTSPLRRCVETASPLTGLWKTTAVLFEAVAEIPAPALPMAARREWLTTGMKGTWAELQSNSPLGSPDYLAWRARLLEAIARIEGNAVIYSHFIAINVVVGAAQGHERVITFSPGHASVTEIEIKDGTPRILKLGEETAGGGLLLGR